MPSSKCENIKKNWKKQHILGKGAFGVVKKWAKNVVIKSEKCDKIKFKRKGFMKDVLERKALTNKLAKAGMAAKTLEVLECGNACVTFMEFVPGKSLKDLLQGASKKEQVNLLIEGQRLIDKFHKKISEHNFGHGDLHTGNIMVTPDKTMKLIDFSFERRLPKSKDWEFFYRSFQRNSKLSDQVINEAKKNFS